MGGSESEDIAMLSKNMGRQERTMAEKMTVKTQGRQGQKTDRVSGRMRQRTKILKYGGMPSLGAEEEEVEDEETGRHFRKIEIRSVFNIY